MSISKGIEQQVALVTGANRGLGKAMVEALINAGIKKVYATARDIDSLSVFQNIEGNDKVVFVAMDITNHQRVEEVAAQASDVTFLVNNAGVLDFGSIVEVSSEQLTRNMDVNFFGTLAVSKAFAPVITANGGGAMVNILTLLSLTSMPGLAAYNASKAAEWSMALSMRASLAEHNIDIHNVFPGAINTDMLSDVDMPKAEPSQVAQAIIQGVINGEEDIFPEAMSQEVYRNWCQDHKAVEKYFAQM